MLFTDDIVLINETKDGLNDKLEKSRRTLESRGFRLSRPKTKYLRCEFNGVEGNGGDVTLGGEVIPKVDKFKYLGSIIEKKGDIDYDINHRIRVGWQKKRNASGVPCDKKIPLSLKGQVYRTVVRPTLLYGAQYWPVKRTQVHRLMVVEMRMIRWMCGYIRLDRIRNDVIREKAGVAPIEEKLRETSLR